MAAGSGGRAGMEGPVAALLTALGYTGQLVKEGVLSQEVEKGPCCPHFTGACSWLVSELKAVSLLEECLTPTTGAEDAETFQLEVSGLLSELHCPYPSLTAGSATSRLNDKQSCLQLLLFLGSELQAARLLRSRQLPQEQQQVPEDAGGGEVFGELAALCRALGVAEPTQDAPVAQLFRDLELKIRDASSSLPEGTVGKPLLSRSLEPGQWEHLEEIHQAMCVEYECRRQMLISRLDVTVQSFHWSERAQQCGAAMGQLYEPLRDGLSSGTGVTLARLLSAREDLSVITRATSQSSREKTACAVNKRGNRPFRPNESAPPILNPN
ncbi:protein FAM98A-like isoform X4 [Pristis pectinata]|uniref:protein FAM98A-like isoform X3 n=1 Tax=Pristis pectinata TaxID=685728 RepID=UPI00223E143B|nr:protein FAM98A-like isoform X3 [Pristis pectinata]XP_051900398.1 protein FAM98A-like isoform X4 [Pristis pectinata]